MSISIPLVRTLLDAVEKCHADPRALLARSGIDPALLEDPMARIDDDTYDRAQLAALELTEDPALGLHMGESASLNPFNVVGYLGANSSTIRGGLEIFFRYHRIISDCASSHLIEQGANATLVYEYPRSTQPVLNQLRAEFGLTRLATLAKLFVGETWAPTEAHFSHAAPPHETEYDRIFRCPVHFEREHTALVTTSDSLDRVQLHTNPELFELLKQQAEKLLLRIDRTERYADKIERLLIEHFSAVKPDMPHVARHLGLSPRSLRRRLSEEDADFSTVRDRALRKIACAILDEPHTTIQHAAYRMGFAEVSSFHRAFKRWTGKTPSEYRSRTT